MGLAFFYILQSRTHNNPSIRIIRRISTDIAILNILKKVAKMLATFLVF